MTRTVCNRKSSQIIALEDLVEQNSAPFAHGGLPEQNSDPVGQLVYITAMGGRFTCSAVIKELDKDGMKFLVEYNQWLPRRLVLSSSVFENTNRNAELISSFRGDVEVRFMPE